MAFGEVNDVTSILESPSRLNRSMNSILTAVGMNAGSI